MASSQTRAEHLAWCKARALEYVNRGDVNGGLTSMFSDMEKHPETRDHIGNRIGLQMMMIGALSSPHEARRFIEGYN